MRGLSLLEISGQINESIKETSNDQHWSTMDRILEQACSHLPSRELRHLIPKVVLVDSYYKANLIKYLGKPNNDKLDFRFGYYKLIAQKLQKLDLDTRIEGIRQTASRLSASNLGDVAQLWYDVSDVVKQYTGRAGDVFASKLLHFSAPELFPILDNNAENKLHDVLSQLDDDANKMIVDLRANVDKELLLDLWYEKDPEIYNKHREEEMKGAKLLGIREEEYPDYCRELLQKLSDNSSDNSSDRYTKFSTNILCLQQAIRLDGGPMYSFRELDKYLYGPLTRRS